MFPSAATASGHVAVINHHYGPVTRAGGSQFWFHGFRNCFITVVGRELMLPRSMTKRLVDHPRPGDVTEGYAANWSIGPLREAAQPIADRIDALLEAGPEWKNGEKMDAVW